IYAYRDDGLTRAGSKLFLNNPRGYGLWLKERAEFLHFSLKKRFKMWYTYYCDLSTCDDAHRVSMRQCADYIGAPLPAIWSAALLHKLKLLIKGK
ncbi:MAG: hypothetical protein IK064_01440, partial [Clostridia bacterium]|nr:hypothetical protein [Clostridia bacterium]